MRPSHIFTVLSLAIGLMGCQREMQFDSTKWKQKIWDSDSYAFREMMIKDVVENRRTIGLPYKVLVDSFGQPENFVQTSKNELWFPVRVENDGIDPVYKSVLVLILDGDSVVERAELRERQHDGDYYTVN